MSRKLLYTFLIIITPVLFITACNNKGPVDEKGSQVPNPASVKCKEEGGTSIIVDDEKGQRGVCEFKDKTVCEEHKFFQGECKKGDCKKECLYANTDKEGWYDNCEYKLIKLEQCSDDKNEEALHGAGEDNKDNEDMCLKNGGKYSRIYNPIKGENLLYCVYEDGSICPKDAYSCKKGDCKKECRAKGTRSEGWYNSCNDELISYAFCSCNPVCKAVSSKSEGWYNSCSDELITYAECSEECKPTCQNIGSRSEGWYDCEGKLIGYDFCGSINDRNVSTRIENTDNYIGMPNPSATKCEDDGYEYVNYKTPFDGEVGYCEFEDGSFCEAWAYFNGECKPKECNKECLHVRSRSEGWFDSCTDRRLTFSFCGDVK